MTHAVVTVWGSSLNMHSVANSLNETEAGWINPHGTQRGFQKVFNAKYLYQNQAPVGGRVQIKPPVS